MLTQEQLDIYFGQLTIPEAGKHFVRDVRGNEPARAVQGGRKNIRVYYPSVKMGVTIQAESSTIEYPYAVLCEHADDVIEYWDQPIQITLSYQSANGGKRHWQYVPDFLVLRNKRCELVECKPEKDLQELAFKDSNRFRKDDSGRWRCPPAEEYARLRGLGFTIVTADMIDSILATNCRFLEPYVAPDAESVPETIASAVLKVVQDARGIELVNLRQKFSGLASVEQINCLIAQHKLHVNLSAVLLTDPNKVLVFADEAQERMVRVVESHSPSATPAPEVPAIIKPARNCPIHLGPLVQKCPHCASPHYPLERYSRPGFCPKCDAWLGTRPTQSKCEHSFDLDEVETAGVADLMAFSSSTSIVPSLSCFRKNLHNAIERLFGGSPSRFAKAAGIHHSTFGDLLTRSKPGIDTLLQISICCGIPPAILISGEVNEPTWRSQRLLEIARRRSCKRYDWPFVKRLIVRELRKPVHRMKSLNKVCRARALDSGYVSKNLKSAAGKLKLKFVTHSSVRHKRRETFEKAHLRSVVISVIERGIWPSHRHLRKVLPKSVCLLNPELSRLRKDVMRQFRLIIR